MANAVTAIINPVHTEPAVPETLLFEIGAVNQLTVSYHPLDTARPAVPYTDNGTTAGNATKPNSLASAAVGGVVRRTRSPDSWLRSHCTNSWGILVDQRFWTYRRRRPAG
jgi:hypothetical protein